MKQYNGEKAIISLTSWKARIKTVSKTIYSLIQKCPGFHIVLVLSEEEFPQKEAELPENLMLLADSDLIEILWVYKNYKSFKKVLFTMDKYRDVPVISADDDCIYTCNYAEELYNVWSKNKTCCISSLVFNKYGYIWTQGASTLYRPYCFLHHGLNNIDLVNELNSNDDAFFGALYKKLKIKCLSINKTPFIFHNTTNSLSKDGCGCTYNAKKDLNNFYNRLK